MPNPPTNPEDLIAAHPDHHLGAAPDHLIGLSKRELFAALAMQGLLANSGFVHTPAKLVSTAVVHADALIDALNRLEE